MMTESAVPLDTGEIGRGLAEMDFGCPPAVTRALTASMAHDGLGYLGVSDTRRLQDAVGGWLADSYGWRVPELAIRPVSDLVAGFRAVLLHFLEEGDSVIVPTPGYMPFISMPEQINRPVVEVPMLLDGTRWNYDFTAIRQAFAAGARMLVLCNPHNPIGKVATADELDELERIVDEFDGLVFADEIHAPILLGTTPHLVYAARSPRAAAHTISATSASKAFNIPGVKCGQLVFSNPAHLEHWNRIGHWYEHQASVLGVVATEAAYAEGRAWLTETVEYLRGTVAEAVATLQHSSEDTGLRVVPPDATYLLWIDLTDTGILRADADAARSVRERARLIVTDGSECGVAGRGYVRFNAALPRRTSREAMERLMSAAKRLESQP